ncbi:MAG: sulfite exporter TauE/SafE family protein, partial [Lysobacterales bacterium]
TITMPILILAGLFLLVAAAYSAVGFGGGSTYNALLILSGTDFRLVPAIALTCNILVVSGGVYHYAKAGVISFDKLLPFVVLSIPMALVGGRLPVSEQIFIGLLGFSLLLAAAQMLIRPNFTLSQPGYTTSRYWLVAAPTGGLIGLLAGITGIGGGIFLAPVIYLFHLAPARTVAGITSGFILVNSIAGLAGQMMKAGDYSPMQGWMDAWPLFVAVLIGGQVGSHLGAYHLPENWIKRLTALLMLYVAARLIWRWAGLSFS